MQQQGLAVQIPVGIDGIFQQECRRAGGNEALRKKFMNGQPLPGPGAHDDGQIRLRRVRLGRGKSGFDADIGFFSRLREGGQARQQHFIGEERRDIEPDDGAPIAHLKLLGDRLQLREDIVDVLEIMGARVRQRQSAHPALEQRHAELLLQSLDLMAHRGRSHEQFLGRGLEALQLGRDLKGLQKFERRQTHRIDR